MIVAPKLSDDLKAHTKSAIIWAVADALAEVKRINVALTRALSPRFEIKERAA